VRIALHPDPVSSHLMATQLDSAELDSWTRELGLPWPLALISATKLRICPNAWNPILDSIAPLAQIKFAHCIRD